MKQGKSPEIIENCLNTVNIEETLKIPLCKDVRMPSSVIRKVYTNIALLANLDICGQYKNTSVNRTYHRENGIKEYSKT